MIFRLHRITREALQQLLLMTALLNAVTVSNVAPGTYYVVAFYDYKDNGTYKGGEGDKYTIYNSTQLTTGASIVTVASDQSQTLAMSLTDAYSFNASGAYISDPTAGTVIVKSIYNGAAADATTPGTKKIYVYLYETWPPANAQVLPKYSGVCSVEVANSTTVYETTVVGVAPGSYYVVVIYDYRKHNSGLKLAGKMIDI